MSEQRGGAEVIDTGVTTKLNAGEVVVDAEPAEALSLPDDVSTPAEAVEPLSIEQRLEAARAARSERRRLEEARDPHTVYVTTRTVRPGSVEERIAKATQARQDAQRKGWGIDPAENDVVLGEKVDEPLVQTEPEQPQPQETRRSSEPAVAEQEPAEVAVASQDFDAGWIRKARERGSKIVEGTKGKYETYATWRDEPYLKQDKDRLERDNPWVDQVEVLQLKSADDVKRLVDGYKEAEQNGDPETWLGQKAWERSIYDTLSGDPVEKLKQLTENQQKYKEEILTLVENSDSVPLDDASEFDAVVNKHGEVVAKYYDAKEKLDSLTGLQAKIAKGAGAVRNVAQKITSYPYAAGIWVHGKLNKAEPTVEDRRLMRAGSYMLSLGALGLAVSRAKSGMGEDFNFDFLSSTGSNTYIEQPSVQPSSNGGGEYTTVPSASVATPEVSAETGAPTPNVDTSTDNEMQIGAQTPAEVETPEVTPPPSTETITVKKGDDWYDISQDLLHEHLRDDKGKRIPLDMGKRQDVIDALRDANPQGLKAGDKIDISTALSTIENLKEEVKFAYDDIASNTSLYKVQAGDTIPEIADRLIEANGGDKRLKGDVVKALIDSNVTYNGSKHWIDEGQILNLEDAQQVIGEKLEALTVADNNVIVEPEITTETTTPEAAVESDVKQPDLDQFDLSTEVDEKLVGNDRSGGSEALTSSQELELSQRRINDVMRTTGAPKASWAKVMAVAAPQLLEAGLATKGFFGNTIIKTNVFGFIPDSARKIINKAALSVTRR